MEELYKKVIELFEKNPPAGHDVKHALRTASLAKQIAKSEGYNAQEAEIAGLMHDLGRTVQKESKGHAQASVPIARELLNTYTDLSDEVKKRILDAIDQHSNPTSEGKLANILQDADKLEGLGAVGISRAYLSRHDRKDYEKGNVYPTEATYGSIKNAHESIVMQMRWYGMLYTDKAKRIGKPRYEFMKQYLEEFKKEVEESEK